MSSYEGLGVCSLAVLPLLPTLQWIWLNGSFTELDRLLAFRAGGELHIPKELDSQVSPALRQHWRVQINDMARVLATTTPLTPLRHASHET